MHAGFVFRHADKVHRIAGRISGKSGKFRIRKDMCQLPGPVRAKVKENQGIARFHLTIYASHLKGNHKFICLTGIISTLQPGTCRNGFWRTALSHSSIHFFDAFPALIPVHSIVAAADTGNFSQLQLFADRFGLFQIGQRTFRRGIPAIQEQVQIHLGDMQLFSHPQ